MRKHMSSYKRNSPMKQSDAPGAQLRTGRTYADAWAAMDAKTKSRFSDYTDYVKQSEAWWAEQDAKKGKTQPIVTDTITPASPLAPGFMAATPQKPSIVEGIKAAMGDKIGRDIAARLGQSKNDATLASNPEYVSTFNSWDLRSAWKDAKMAARKMRRTGSSDEDINKYLETAAGDISRISKEQRERQINPRTQATYKKSPAMKMIFKK